MAEKSKDFDIKERFQLLDQQKKEAAKTEEEKIKKETRDKLENSLAVRLGKFISGDADDFTDEELMLLDTITDYSLLTVDENGHLCLAEGKTEGDVDYAKKYALENLDPDNEDTRKKLALYNALNTENPEIKPAEEEDLQILRIEDLDFVTANVYVGLAKNETTNEGAYGIVMDTGYGQSRKVTVAGERVYGRSEKNMAFRALSYILAPFANQPQAITNITIFIEHDIGWIVEQNSWNLITEAYDNDAAQYSNLFKKSRGMGANISIAPAEAKGSMQTLAQSIADELCKAPN